MSDEMSTNMGPYKPVSTLNMMPGNMQMPVNPSMSKVMPATITYPEIYYKLQPYILMVRDSLTSIGRNPTQEELDQISDSIYDDICKRDPDLKDYLNNYDPKDPPADDPPFRGGFRGEFRPGLGFGFRRRGLGRDLIDALLLAQLFGRPYPSPYPYPYLYY